MNQILENLYLTSFDTCKNYELLKSHNIQLIINCAKECNHTNLPTDIKYVKVDLIDDPHIDISTHFDTLADIINDYTEQNKNVLVHCKYGKSRSASIILAYLIKYHKMTFEDSLLFLKTKRQSACPNMGFAKQLENFYLSLIKNH